MIRTLDIKFLAASSTRHIYPCQAFLIESKVPIMSPRIGIMRGGVTLKSFLLPQCHDHISGFTLHTATPSAYA